MCCFGEFLNMVVLDIDCYICVIFWMLFGVVACSVLLIVFMLVLMMRLVCILCLCSVCSIFILFVLRMLLLLRMNVILMVVVGDVMVLMLSFFGL